MAITRKSSLSHLDSLAAAAKSASETIHDEAQVWGGDAATIRRSLHNTLIARGVPEDRAGRVTRWFTTELSNASAHLITAAQELDALRMAVAMILDEANDVPRRQGAKPCTSLPTGVS